MSGPRRNVELKAVDRDPEKTLRRALDAGAEDRGTLRQRDTYFTVAEGRLKLREEEPGGATLIAYRRADEARERLSAYHLAPVSDPAALRAALAEVPGVRAVVDKRRRLLVWEGTVRIHLDEVEGLRDRYLEIEAVAPADSDLAREHEQVQRLEALLGTGEMVSASYAELLAGEAGPGPHAGPPVDPALLAMAREVRRSAYAPYSGFQVGAALRTSDGRRYAGANVENAAYPQGQCAEASAVGAMVAGGGGRIAEVVVVGQGDEVITLCGGCRQRLREFGAAELPIHLADDARIQRSITLGELLPLSFGPEHL